MNLRVLGCHGGASVRHRTTSFVVDERLGIDAGALAAGLTLEEQIAIDAVLLSHSHMDHVADLGTLADLSQQAGTTVVVAGIPPTVEALRTHFFNDVLWPDFTRIPSAEAPAVELRVLAEEEPARFGHLEALPIPVHHSVPSCGYLITSDEGGCLAYSGDTGPTERFWEVTRARTDLRAVITEVSYPDRQHDLAAISGHLTPALLVQQLGQLNRTDVPILLYGMKPFFEEEIVAELEGVEGFDVRILAAGDRMRF